MTTISKNIMLPGHYKAKVEYEIHLFHTTDNSWTAEEFISLVANDVEIKKSDMTSAAADGDCGVFKNVVENVASEFDHSDSEIKL